MRKIISWIARFLAGIFALLFVITTILALLLTIINRQLFASALYKSALAETMIYERLPALLGRTLTESISYNPCAGNPVACEDNSPELKACYEQVLGNERYNSLAAGKDKPTESEKTKIQGCVDQYGSPEKTVTLGGSDGQSGMPPFMKNLSLSDWEALVNLILPPKEMQIMVEGGLDRLFSYLNGETNAVRLSMTTVKEHLAGQSGIQLIKLFLDGQPACTESELSKINQGLVNGESIYCKPPDNATLLLMLPDLQKQLDQAEKSIPDEVVLIKPPSSDMNPASGPFGSDPMSTIRTLRLILQLSLLVPLLFLSLITIFAVRSFKGWMRWWGIPFFFSGIIALALGFFAQPAMNWFWIMYIVPRTPPYFPADITSLGLELIHALVHIITDRIYFWSTILIVFGLAAWIGSALIKPKRTVDTSEIPLPNENSSYQ
jgi:hypothetical protein